MTKTFDAFISYGRADSKEFATKLQARLNEQGFRVWFDFNDIPLGVDFQNQIDDGIEKACHFLFLISPHSVNSLYCRKEIELAIKLNKRIFPLLHVMQISQETWQQRNPNGTAQDWEVYKLKGLHDSYQNMHPTIQKLNWVYFQEDNNDFEKSLASLVTLLRSHPDYVEQHTKFLVKALEWERNQKQTRYLLTGSEKQQAEAWLKIRFKNEQPPCVSSNLHCEYITESIKNANNLMTQVFLSYAHQDKETMEKIRASLRQESITVWANTTDIQTGEAFELAIKRGIEQADNIVYLLSPDSIKSSYCQMELDLALSFNKRIIPLLVRETDEMQMPPVLQSLQYIDFTDNVKEEDYLLDSSQLLKILHEDADYYNEHKILLTKALNWERQHYNPSILLRGYNLQSAEAWLKVANKRTQHPPIPLQEKFINESLQQPPLESLDVFISYSRADSDFARKLNDSLQIQGKTTWFDQESIASGSDFQQEIYRGIKTCGNFLFILSPRSVNSPYCKDEVEYASKLNKRFVTVLLTAVNTNDLHPELAKVQWIDFNHSQRDFNANFNQLVITLDTDREHVHSHSKWLQRALEWEQKHRSDDLLLRGNEFLIAQTWLIETQQQKKKPVATLLQEVFIETSKKAIEAAELEKRRQAEVLRLESERAKEALARLAEQKKNAKRQKLFLVTITMALVAAVGFGTMAWKKEQEAEAAQEAQLGSLSQFSLALSQQNLKFDALLEAIRVERQAQNLGSELKPETQSLILSALQAAVYGSEFRKQYFLEHTSTVTDVSFNPKDKTIVTGSEDGTIKIWGLHGEKKSTIKVDNGGIDANVNSVAWSPDGNTIASGDDKNTVKLWSKEGKHINTLTGHTMSVNSVVWSPDGNTIASASDDKTVILWNKQKKRLQTLKGHKYSVNSVSFSPDGKTIATASDDGSIKIWGLNGEKKSTIKVNNSGIDDSVNSVAWSSDGNTIVSGYDNGTVKLWSKEGKHIRTFTGHKASVNSLAWSPDGKTIASASDDSTVRLWDKEGKLLETLSGHDALIRSVKFSSDGKTIVTASEDNTVIVWSKSGKRLKTLQGDMPPAWNLAWSPDGNTIAHGTPDGTVKLWNKKGKLLREFKELNSLLPIMSVAWSPDGNTFAAGGVDNTVKLWNKDGQQPKTLKGHTDPVWSVAWSPDGNTIASGSLDNTVKLWNRDGQQPNTLKGHKAGVMSVAWSPDGNTLASGSLDKSIKLWDKKGQLLQDLKRHNSKITSVSFSLDGNVLASASDDNTIILWSKKGHSYNYKTTLEGHKAGVFSVTFSPDGNTIASSSLDSTVRLWNKKGEPLQTLFAHNQMVSSVSFSPDSKTLASASNDKTILWNLKDLQLDLLMKNGCAQMRDYLDYNAQGSNRDLCKNINKN
ncbi:TIR domain-containing protein [Scytonema sp. UIC 10036]|uniref:TIR domain-containing protein n=1 Tax=Scytonema sp. UIC 10036 TaxID=2304196 RepID=UPI0012DA5A45|nr:TIR domain-containing protein [Scytonema sp. UIC 10036]MUG95497.1 TIR domain-containing protein [Scytonema sp. UIC 10036]